MKIKALITTLALLGTSSLAMARPYNFSVSAEASWSISNRNAPVVVRDHREPVRTYEPVVVREPMMFPSNNALAEDASVYKGPLPIPATRVQRFSSGYVANYHSQWTAITAPTRIDRGRQFVTDLPNLGAFTRVRLQSVTGSSEITTVLIRFADGGEQIVNINRCLDTHSSIDIMLDGGARQIHGFVVYGSTNYGAAYQILAL